MNAFIAFFTEINLKMREDGNVGFFAVPLHRLFGYYLTRYVMHNYLQERQKYPQKEAKDIF